MRKRKDVEKLFLTFTIFWANSTNDKLMTFFLFFPENRFLTFHANCPMGDNLHEMSKTCFLGKIRKMLSAENFTLSAKR